jgi:hypothetical protein
MTKIDELMALADEYAKAWHASQTSRVIAAYDDGEHRKALRAALEAALKPGEPVAWMDSSGHPRHIRHLQSSEERRLYGELQPLYAAPPAQTPVEKS